MLISKIVQFIVICSLKFTRMQTETSVSVKSKHDQLKILMVCPPYVRAIGPHGHGWKQNNKSHVANWHTI